ncbi:hypothetical protein F4859DRAFT_141926 [Xylaria cf. heliscus]|nr:hypothetical protein F4859DRAFT_141926 [Xylaria cf. heliscus]
MAFSSIMQRKPPPLRFTVPRTLQRFDLFKLLPYDIRYMIWQLAIFTSGIHFLKFVDLGSSAEFTSSIGANRGGSLVTRPEGPINETAAEDAVYSAILKPIFGLDCANNSHYIVTNKTLSQLSESCDEAKHVVERVLAQPGNLRLDDGQLILLQRSSDIVCIDYPDMTHARCLGKWAENLDLDQLAKIRRLAIRYHHEWDNNLVCPRCGRIHSYLGKHPHPHHVYEFAALFKNLEAFYFIDYLTLRTPQCLVPDSSGLPAKFSSGENGRIYFEVNQQSCTTHTLVHETLLWLRNSYIDHCNQKSRGPSNPENVRFGVLGCEWDSDQKLAPPKRLGTQNISPTKKKRPRNYIPSRNSTINFKTSPPQPTNPSTLPVVFGDAGSSHFEFNLNIPHYNKA